MTGPKGPYSGYGVHAYTVYLFILGGLALLMVFSHQMLIGIYSENLDDRMIMLILRFVQAIEVVLAVFAVSVATLRVRQSPLAGPTTAAVSILLALWLPFGTAAFIWWVGWVRQHEGATEQNQPSTTSDD